MKQNNDLLWSTGSIVSSFILASTPPVLYFLASSKSGVTELLFVAAFYFSLAALFLLAKWYSHKIALLAIIRWLFESFATFLPSYRLYFYGGLALCAGTAYLVKVIRLIL